jgi:hypothetical protein
MPDIWRSIAESVVRDMVMSAYHLALRYGDSPVEAVAAVVEDVAYSGFGLARILQMGWPDEIAAIMDGLYEDLRGALDRERVEAENLQRWRDGNPAIGNNGPSANDGPSASVLPAMDDDVQHRR